MVDETATVEKFRFVCESKNCCCEEKQFAMPFFYSFVMFAIREATAIYKIRSFFY